MAESGLQFQAIELGRERGNMMGATIQQPGANRIVVPVGWSPSAGEVTGAEGVGISSIEASPEVVVPEVVPEALSAARFFSRQWRVRRTRVPR